LHAVRHNVASFGLFSQSLTAHNDDDAALFLREPTAMGSLTDLTNKANALKASGDLAGAVAAYEQIAEMAPNNGPVIHNLAGALGDAGRNAEAVIHAKRALATGLDAPETWLVLARALAGDGKPDDAVGAFRECVKRRPADRIAQRELAQLVWMLTGDLEKSLASVTDALARMPGAVDLQLLRAEIIGQSGDAEGEYREVSAILKTADAGNPALMLAVANAAHAAGKYADALDHALAAMALAPQDRSINAGMARAYLAIGDAREASLLASRLHATYPLDQHYIALQAIAWRMIGDERYHQIYNYHRFVATFPLSCPKGWNSAEAYVDELVAALDRRHQYLTHPFGQSVRTGSQLPSIFSLGDPVLNAYSEAIRGPVQSYLHRLGAGGDPLRVRNRGGHKIFSAWSVRLKSSGFHIDHVHPEGWLSSASHLRMPPAKDANDRSGWLKFGEPGIPTAPKLAAEHFVKPQIGVMAIFPSYMWHGTVPFSSDVTRLTVAIDLVPAPPI
jgi:tetratricopeptide (TPR) repeat protein